MGTRLFVGNLSYTVTELELKEAFSSEGIEVRSVRLACERETGRPRGFAFVETATDDGAKQSIEKLARPQTAQEAMNAPLASPTAGANARRKNAQPGPSPRSASVATGAGRAFSTRTRQRGRDRD